MNLVIISCFFVAGSSLLRLGEVRIHEDLPPPSKHGLSMTSFARLFGWRWAPAVFSAVALVLVLWSIRDSARGGWVDASISFVGLGILGSGFLRELNRHRTDPVGIITALSLLLYAVLQLFLPILSLTVLLYTTGIVFKWSLLLGLVAFFVAGRETSRAYRIADAEFSEKVSGLLHSASSARHDIFNATWEQGMILDELIARSTPQNDATALDRISRLGRLSEMIEESAESLLSISDSPSKVVSMSEVLGRVARELNGLRGASVTCEPAEDEGPHVPFEALREALHRVVENAAQAGAQRVILRATRTQSFWHIHVVNDGPAIDGGERVSLFVRRRGGLWVARRILTNLGGILNLVSAAEGHVEFELVVPDEQ